MKYRHTVLIACVKHEQLCVYMIIVSFNKLSVRQVVIILKYTRLFVYN